MGEVEPRLTVLETTVTEWRAAHKVESKIIWSNFDEKFKAIFIKLDKLVGSQETRKDACMKDVNKRIALVIGIPTTLGAIIGVVVVIVKLLNL